MRRTAIAIVLMLTASAAVFGTSAFTTATVDRGTSLDVVSDDSAVIALAPGSSGMVTKTTDGELTIDAAVSGATGVNGNAAFTLGDNSSANSTYGFTITNNAGTSKDINVSYSGFVDDGKQSLQFELYDADNNHLGTVEEGSPSHTVTGLGDGETVYVVVEIRTTNGDLGKSSDLSGTLTISA